MVYGILSVIASNPQYIILCLIRCSRYNFSNIGLKYRITGSIINCILSEKVMIIFGHINGMSFYRGNDLLSFQINQFGSLSWQVNRRSIIRSKDTNGKISIKLHTVIFVRSKLWEILAEDGVFTIFRKNKIWSMIERRVIRQFCNVFNNLKFC